MLTSYVEPELTKPVYLCHEDGTFNRASIGWSRHPLHICNLKWTWPRPKRWNYWNVTGERFSFSVAVSDRGYVGVGTAAFFEYETKRHIVRTGERFLGHNVVMPETVHADLQYEHEDLRLSFTTDGPEHVILRATCADFGGVPLSAELVVNKPVTHETLNVVIPWSDELFQFTSKQECLPTTGIIHIGDETLEFAPGAAFATLDFGRGFWPRSSSWNWGAASGVQNGRVVGLNLGGKWTDRTGMNENGFVVDGRLHKIHEDLIWEYDTDDFMKSWRMRTAVSDRVCLDFKPMHTMLSETDWGHYKRSVNFAYGHYRGYVTTDEDERIELSNLFGWAEELHALW